MSVDDDFSHLEELYKRAQLEQARIDASHTHESHLVREQLMYVMDELKRLETDNSEQSKILSQATLLLLSEVSDVKRLLSEVLAELRPSE